MIIVADIKASKQFYTDILQEQIQLDLGNYVVLNGFSMMTRAQWNKLTNDAQQENAGHSFELYFEEDRIDAFSCELETRPGVRIFNPLEAAPWGQRAIRFLDPMAM
jgi:catechol 2,3-dioxygenase-like lactoylglutathione lyase family enzyme